MQPLGHAPRIGFLGAGRIATFHSKLLRRCGVDHARGPVYDPDPQRAAAFVAAAGGTVATTEDEVLEASDAVYVATWTSEHPRLVAAAAARGVHVFCEKPLAVDLAGAESMLATVEAAGVVHQVGLILRRSPAFLAVRDLVTAPAAGRVMAIVFRDDQYLPVQGEYASTWRADRRLAGAGTLLEHSIHDVDLLRWLAGEVTGVVAHQANVHGLDGIEDVVTASIRFDTGALASLTSVWHDNLARPSLRRLEVLCERRHVVVEGDWFGPVEWTDSDGAIGTLAGEELLDLGARLVAGSNDADGDFVRCVTDGRPAHPDFGVAVAGHRVVDAIYRSAASGREVVLGPDRP